MTEDARQSNDRGKGLYANYFEIGYNAFEVVIVFGQRYSKTATVPCHTQIVTSPSYAKELARILEHSIRDYEMKYGPIGSVDRGDPSSE